MVDLRQIPIVIGGLYFGFGPWLAVSAMLIRGLFFGFDTGWWTGLPIYISLAVFLWFTHPWFLRQSAKKRFHFSMGTITFTSLISISGLFLMGHPFNGIPIWLIVFLVQVIGLGMIVYLLEALMQNDFLREQIVKAQKMEMASHMSAAISHEVRNPMTAAQGFLKLVSEDVTLTDKTKQYIGIASTELKAAEQVIQDYLTFAKPEVKDIERIWVDQELNRVIQTLQPLANMNSVKFITENTSINCIIGDKGHFRQSFLNILKNSIESMPNGGTLTIKTVDTHQFVKVSVQDTGFGMSAAQLKRLGEPYYSTKGKNGTGLGLMVAYSIIRNLKGSIKVNSELGKGTEFIFTFPEHIKETGI